MKNLNTNKTATQKGTQKNNIVNEPLQGRFGKQATSNVYKVNIPLHCIDICNFQNETTN